MKRLELIDTSDIEDISISTEYKHIENNIKQVGKQKTKIKTPLIPKSNNIKNNIASSVDDFKSKRTAAITGIVVAENDKLLDDEDISEFIKFCIKHRLFDDTFYDLSNIYSVIATKLPYTFNDITKGKQSINRVDFIKIFQNRFKYTGNISYVFDCMDSKKISAITWEEFRDFFLPFVRNITF
jgi:hypothetical protein